MNDKFYRDGVKRKKELYNPWHLAGIPSAHHNSNGLEVSLFRKEKVGCFFIPDMLSRI